MVNKMKAIGEQISFGQKLILAVLLCFMVGLVFGKHATGVDDLAVVLSGSVDFFIGRSLNRRGRKI